MEFGGGVDWQPRTFCRALQIVLLILTAVTVAIQAQSCASNARLPSEVLLFTVDKCQDVWDAHNFTLRFKQDVASQTLSIVLSVPKEKRWYGIGFNRGTSMVGSSAVIAWVDETSGAPSILPYYLGAQNPDGVEVDTSSLVFKTKPALVSTEDDYLYMTFEIDQAKSTAAGFDNQVLAMGYVGDLPQKLLLQEHEFRTQLAVNYQTGSVVTIENNTPHLAKAHGGLNIFGWGVLLPIGAIVARYARANDPAWFYLHVTLQGLGYVFIIAGIATGVELTNRLVGVDYNGHRGLGIFVFVLATLQVSAVLIRPNKDAKIRRYWNWGHWWFGRLGLFLSAINIFVGIHVANAGTKWKAGYAIILALELLVVVVLEILLWIKLLRGPDESLPQTAMTQRRDPQYDSSPASAPPPPYGSSNWDTR